MASLELDQGNLSEAIRLYEEGHRRTSDLAIPDWNYHYHLGRVACLERSGDAQAFRKALGCETAAGQRVTDRGETLLSATLLGKILARNGDWQRAQELVAQVRPLALTNGSPVWRAHSKILEGEIALAQGHHPEALQTFERVVLEADLLQAHESLARAYEASGDVDEAIEQYLWIGRHRGRAYAEGMNPASRALNVLDAGMASFHLGRLYDAQGKREEARVAYRRFLQEWPEGDQDIPAVQLAKRRLGAIEAKGPGAGDQPAKAS